MCAGASFWMFGTCLYIREQPKIVQLLQAAPARFVRMRDVVGGMHMQHAVCKQTEVQQV
jgi:hypothetical protein